MRKILTILISTFVVLVLAGAGCVSLSSKKSTTSGPAGMFISTDKGESWKSISSVPTLEGVKSMSSVSVYRLIEDPQDPKAMYIASRKNGMFYSYDDGKSWAQEEAPVSSGFIYSAAVHPADKCIVYATNGRQIFKTTDCSRSWTEIYRESRSNVNINSLAFNQFPPYQIYVGESNGDLLYSVDEGQSWSRLASVRFRIQHIITNPLIENQIFAISRESGLRRSNDAGKTWESLNDGFKTFSGSLEYRRHYLHPTKPGVLYWVSDYGILVSYNSGDSWEAYELITPPGSAKIYGFAVNPNNEKEIYYTATINDRSTFYKSLDGGKNWITKKLPSGQLPTAMRVHPENGDWIYLGFTIPPQQ